LRSKKPILFRIWYFTENDRRETARIKAYDFESVQKFLLDEFIKPEFRDQVDLDEYGLSWMDNEPKECLEQMRLDEPDNKEYKDEDFNPCESCDGCTVGFQIEEVEEPDGKSWGETWEFKTIYGTNDFWDLTKDKPEKSPNWNPLLAHAWKISPQTGCDMLVGLTKFCSKCGEMKILLQSGLCEECEKTK